PLRHAPSHDSTLSLHDALPISGSDKSAIIASTPPASSRLIPSARYLTDWIAKMAALSSTFPKVLASSTSSIIIKILYIFFYSHRSEEHTSELQSRENLVCRLLL